MIKEVIDRIYSISLILIALTLPLPMLTNNFAILLFIFAVGVNFRFSSFSRDHLILLIPLTILLVDIVSIVNSEDYIKALKTIEKRSSLFIFSLGFLVLNKISNKQLINILNAFVISVLIIVVVATLKAFITHYNAYGFNFNYQSYWLIGNHKFSEPVGLHATYLSNYIIFCISIILFYKEKGFWKNKYLKALTIIILFFGLMILAVRTSFVILCIVLFYYLHIRYRRQRKKFIISLLVLFAVLFTIVFNNTILRERFEDVFSIGKSERDYRFGGSELRQIKWTTALKVFYEQPIFGVGNGDIQKNLNAKYKKLNQTKYNLYNYNSHNQYLNDLAAKGIIGLIVLFLFLVMAFTFSLSNKNHLLFILMIITSISFFTENVLTRNKGIVFIFFFFGLLVSNILYNKGIFKDESTSNT